MKETEDSERDKRRVERPVIKKQRKLRKRLTTNLQGRETLGRNPGDENSRKYETGPRQSQIGATVDISVLKPNVYCRWVKCDRVRFDFSLQTDRIIRSNLHLTLSRTDLDS